ncbi:hypothetical protein Clacol_004488 [Clathrus columnatus]|uniref:GH18 domain-containing protein n=1 Tax=Clathrus columnatus TaxID=1419009 RepID=A0AAV5A6M7_9AGAM|nr:hypothetical protein Clacol_004488 [Clathrus columnatus]
MGSSLSFRSFWSLLTLLTLIVSITNNAHASPTPFSPEELSRLVEPRHFVMPKEGELILADNIVDPCTLSTTTTTQPQASSPAKTTAKPPSTPEKTTVKPSSTPTPTKTTTKPSPTTSSKPPATPSPTSSSRFVIYDDTPASGFPSPAKLQGFNTYILAFYLSNAGPFDLAEMWASLTAAQRSTMRANYKAVGVDTILVSAFGSTDIPTTTGVNPTTMAQKLAQFVSDFGLDGVDVDYEDFNAVQAGTAVAWLVTLTTELRSLMGPNKILTHAPVAPWFGLGGPYLMLDQKVGSQIDWYNIQFYSQGTEYTTCDSLVTQSGGVFPNTSIKEIMAAGVPQQKLVIGKPGKPSDVGVSLRRRGLPSSEGDNLLEDSHLIPRQINTNGFIDPATLATCVNQAKALGWRAGVMTWEFPDADNTWIKTVREQAFPDWRSDNETWVLLFVEMEVVESTLAE